MPLPSFFNLSVQFCTDWNNLKDQTKQLKPQLNKQAFTNDFIYYCNQYLLTAFYNIQIYTVQLCLKNRVFLNTHKKHAKVPVSGKIA